MENNLFNLMEMDDSAIHRLIFEDIPSDVSESEEEEGVVERDVEIALGEETPQLWVMPD